LLIFEVEKVYLVVQDKDDDEAYSFIRKRTTVARKGEKKGSIYQLTDVIRRDGQQFETKRIISGTFYVYTFLVYEL